MKAKYYFGIIALLLISSTGIITAAIEIRNTERGNETVVINNYHEDYDFHFSSRINRFHRSYSTFSYYAPVFTDTYWYSPQPFTWGISIYGGAGFGIGFAYNYPVYNYPVYNRVVTYNYNWYNPWYDPWYSGGYYAGYDSYYYGGWYRPVYVNVRYRNNWHHSQPVHYSYNSYNGYNGFKGSKGYNGYKGDKGYKGDNGDKDDKGYKGDKDDKGYKGDKGYRGSKGYITNSINSTNRTVTNSNSVAPKREEIASKAPAESRRIPDNNTARSYENRAGNVNSMKNSPAVRNINTEARTFSKEAVKKSTPANNQAVRRAEAPVRQERSSSMAIGSNNERQRSVSAPVKQERSSSMAMGSNNERQRSVSAPLRSSAPARSAPAATQRKSTSGGGESRTATSERSAAEKKPSGRR